MHADLRALPSDFTPRAARRTLFTVGAVAGTSLLDRPIDRALGGDSLTTLADISEALEWTGGPQVNAFVAGTFVVSLFTNRPKFQDAAFII